MPYPNAGAISHPGGGQGPGGPTKALAIIFAIVAAFLWATELYNLTISQFRAIALQNYGMLPLHWMEVAYSLFLHIAVFVAARVTFEIALTAIISAGAYRLAF
ncbi:hypothetical protein [Leisingera caerulea]|uniref:hypothetical protein n=1 Tax=Leisingera caerulea TaxID=506591 RepID=UPI0021A5EE9E|nr:hypothetical protein [Leisingera caerulea]UWQ83112.1 hypothetical protein K3726_15820 [Leisingera caerulea]